jgi:hypothetical protein
MNFREFLFQRLSDKSLEGSRRFGIALLKVAKWCLWVSFEHSLESRSGPFRNYQTVSPRTPVNRVNGKLIASPLRRDGLRGGMRGTTVKEV